ncbi:hypothetical protein CWC05_11810 [Pseudoalteromonas ruthenica]|uniref:Tetratricopeptide repeat protein n=1 Tax=Pseudoalteromonas ruthenica TaxID=151081 RepID=A0A5S3Z523_9GAMM|nr:hypothetical protein [Pseudoalteromonas ruthenica]TLX49969.1 hypothetical protein CWC31_14055 [Pseudoalteromonas ruthenica]TMP86697.1 hypothetical protein CWC05_11810 [Pseudoalteromonas ruthenica]
MSQSPLTDLPWVQSALTPWQVDIQAGNHAFNAKQWHLARDKYTVAYQLSYRLMAQFLTLKDEGVRCQALAQCSPAMVVAAHNLADAYIRLGNLSGAAHTLTQVHANMLVLRQHSDPSVMHIGAIHSDKTYAQLMHFAKLYGPNPETHKQLQHALNQHSVTHPTFH